MEIVRNRSLSTYIRTTSKRDIIIIFVWWIYISIRTIFIHIFIFLVFSFIKPVLLSLQFYDTSVPVIKSIFGVQSSDDDAGGLSFAGDEPMDLPSNSIEWRCQGRFLQNVSTGDHTRSVLQIRLNGYPFSLKATLLRIICETIYNLCCTIIRTNIPNMDTNNE